MTGVVGGIPRPGLHVTNGTYYEVHLDVRFRPQPNLNIANRSQLLPAAGSQSKRSNVRKASR